MKKFPREQQPSEDPYSPPLWASWLEKWCGEWHQTTDEKATIEIGLLAVRLKDGSVHPGIVYPAAGLLVAGEHAFQAQEANGKKYLKMLSPDDSTPSYGCQFPTEGETYEEDDDYP